MNEGTDPAVLAAMAAEEEHAEFAAQEEEIMSQYSREDLESDWEFKIVRSSAAAFGDPKVFVRLLREEARFGWVMLEKLDDSRVRFNRRRPGTQA